MMRKPIIGGNWKMNRGTPEDTRDMLEKLTSLISEIKNVDIDWIGHATFVIKGMKSGKVIVTDPFADTAVKADVVLITHDHFDHCDKAKIDVVSKEGTLVVGNPSVVRKLGGGELISLGQSKDFDGVSVKAVPAYNVDKFRSPGGQIY